MVPTFTIAPNVLPPCIIEKPESVTANILQRDAAASYCIIAVVEGLIIIETPAGVITRFEAVELAS